MAVAASWSSALGSHTGPLAGAEIEEIEPLVLLVGIAGLGVAAPDNEHTGYECRGVTDSRKRDLSGRLHQCGRKVSGVKGVEVILDGFADETAEEEEFAALGCNERGRVAISGKGRGRGACLLLGGAGSGEQARGREGDPAGRPGIDGSLGLGGVAGRGT